jgi:hypothetical protein
MANYKLSKARAQSEEVDALLGELGQSALNKFASRLRLLENSRNFSHKNNSFYNEMYITTITLLYMIAL